MLDMQQMDMLTGDIGTRYFLCARSKRPAYEKPGAACASRLVLLQGVQAMQVILSSRCVPFPSSVVDDSLTPANSSHGGGGLEDVVASDYSN